MHTLNKTMYMGVTIIIWLTITIVGVVSLAWILDYRDEKIKSKKINKVDQNRGYSMEDSHRYTGE
ncbi:hypothetical protein [Heyndrickxia vini]|uniref:Uncharacterized protein n=1 Tax=Heyndrickxia vini TaxID=1476025 RepID=A0ABX7E1W5_9BACI|nr:hypothetical protein [Heyndrickxia vini]QQZ09708.1 hypothetical protein I5776_01615 [Heyndrickxia vini]